MLQLQPEFQSNQSKTLTQPFSLPDGAMHGIWSQLANWLNRYTSLKLRMDYDQKLDH